MRSSLWKYFRNSVKNHLLLLHNKKPARMRLMKVRFTMCNPEPRFKGFLFWLLHGSWQLMRTESLLLFGLRRSPWCYRIFRGLVTLCRWDIALSQWSGPLKLSLNPVLTSVSGKILHSESANPLGKVLVKIGARATRTDSDGNFAFKGIKPGYHQLSCFVVEALWKLTR